MFDYYSGCLGFVVCRLVWLNLVVICLLFLWFCFGGFVFYCLVVVPV